MGPGRMLTSRYEMLPLEQPMVCSPPANQTSSMTTLQRPGDVFGGEWIAIVPGDALAHIHPNLAAVVIPAPVGNQPRAKAEVGVLRDKEVKDRLVEPLDRGVHGGQANGWVPAGQVDVIGDDQLVNGRKRWQADGGKGGRRGRGLEKASSG